MRRCKTPSVLIVVFVLLLSATCSAEDWTRFRGPNGSGVSTSETIPLEWNDDKNIKWKVDLAGPGSSSPIVFGDRVYLTCYTDYGVDKEEPGQASALVRHLFCFDRASGKEIWKASVAADADEDEYQGFITEHGFASSTPVTDGKHIYVLYGKTGVVAFDMDGNQMWKASVGTESDPYKWGGGASTVLVGDLLIVNAANVGRSFVALDKATGKEVWKYANEKLVNCWATPIMVSANGRDELVTCVPGKIVGLDPKTGEELWVADSPIANTTCASLVEHNGAVFAMGGRAGDAVGVRYGGEGDVTDSHTLWVKKLRSGIGTPVVVGGNMYWVSTGTAFCASCESGEYVYKQRLGEQADEGRRRPAGSYASALAVGENVILLTRNGTSHIIKGTGEFNQVAENKLESDEGPFNATPAISDGDVFIRSNKSLYCISKG